MKSTFWFAGGLILLLVIAHCGEKEETGIKGTWKMISGKYMMPSGSVDLDIDNRLCYKIISDDHFAVVEMYKSNPESLFFAAVGKYTLEGDIYAETLEGCNIAADVGRTNVFHSELSEEGWRITMKREDMELDETWEKIRTPVNFTE
jgi:hypothetical protein